MKCLETAKRKQLICTVKYAEELGLLAKDKTVLQGMIDRLTEIYRRYGMEIKCEKKI